MLTLEAGQTLQGVSNVASRITYTLEGFELDSGQEDYKTLAQGQLPTSAGALYTVPSGVTAFIKSLIIANGGGTANFKLFVGGTADANAITGTITLATSEYAIYEEGGWRICTAAGFEKLRNA